MCPVKSLYYSKKNDKDVIMSPPRVKMSLLWLKHCNSWKCHQNGKKVSLWVVSLLPLVETYFLLVEKSVPQVEMTDMLLLLVFFAYFAKNLR